MILSPQSIIMPLSKRISSTSSRGFLKPYLLRDSSISKTITTVEIVRWWYLWTRVGRALEAPQCSVIDLWHRSKAGPLMCLFINSIHRDLLYLLTIKETMFPLSKRMKELRVSKKASPLPIKIRSSQFIVRTLKANKIRILRTQPPRKSPR